MSTINSNKDLKSSKLLDRPFLNLNTKLERKVFVDNLMRICKLEGLDDDIIKDLETYAWKLIVSFTSKYLRLSSDNCRKEFRDASKRHQRTLNTILSNVVECLMEPSSVIHITYYNNNVSVFINSMQLLDVDVHPRSFSIWYNGLKLISNHINIPNSHKLVICRALTTLYSIVNEPVLRESEEESLVEEVLVSLESPAQFVEPEEYFGSTSDSHPYKKYIDDIKETIYLIKRYLDQPINSVPNWAKSICVAINRVRRNNKLYVYDNTSPVLSSNSSGTSIKVNSKRITLPALFASVIEPDNCNNVELIKQFDNIVGFNQVYNINKEIIDQLDAKSFSRKSSKIKQKKPKPRVIHILNNSEQDRLGYFHNILASVLSNLQEDCTFDQSKGPAHIRQTMNSNPSRAVYSLDLTAASDNFNIGLQYLIIKELLLSSHPDSEVLADSWYYLMTQDSVYIKPDGSRRNVHFRSGQAQGYLSSFPAFALEHHIVVLTTLRMWNEGLIPNSFYRVLGDDLVITVDDPEFKIPGLYINYINAANVKCGLDKGYIYNINFNNYSNKIAEFAKYLIIDGYDLTPIPYKLLMADTLSDQLGLVSWLSIHRQEKYSINNVIYYLEDWSSFYSRVAKPVLGIMCLLNIPGVITQSFKREFKKIDNYNIIDYKIILEVLSHNMIYGVINRLTSNKPFELTTKTLIHLTNELKIMYKYLDDPLYTDINNKMSILRTNIYNANNIFREYIMNYSSFDELSNDDLEIIMMYLCTNNDKIVKEKLNSLSDSLQLLIQDIEEVEYSNNINEYYIRVIEILKNFNINIERSWSSYGKKAPTEYIISLGKVFNSVIENTEFKTLEEYLESNTLSIEPEQVVVPADDLDSNNFSFLFDNDSIFG